MPRSYPHRLRTLQAVLRQLLPAWLCFAAVAFIEHPLSLVILLAGNALCLVGVCRAFGFDRQGSFGRNAARRGVAYFVLLSLYTALLAGLIALPAHTLSQGGSLPAVLALSGALFAAVLALWRVWPAFALPLLWDDAYPRADQRGSWLLVVLRRSLAFAHHLTAAPEHFFAYGLPASLGILGVAAGTLVISGAAQVAGPEARLTLLAIHALLLSPLAHILLINRSLRLMLKDAREAEREPPEAGGEAPADAVAPTAAPEMAASTLLEAARRARIGEALAALERGADADGIPEPGERDQRTVLMIAAALPDLRLLRALIAAGADVNLTHGGATPLLAATRDSHAGRPEAVATLLANGADPRQADAAGNTPLHHAAGCGDPGISAMLLDAGAELDASNGDGVTALALACRGANWPVAEFLLERGARPDREGASPALLAAASVLDDDPCGVRLLLKRRAKVDAADPLGRTALLDAALAGHAEIVSALLAAGAAVDHADQRGTTALMDAARIGSAATIDTLARRKANPELRDVDGRDALTIACQARHAREDVVRSLLALGADPRRTGPDGRRAVDHAIAAGRWHLVALLDPSHVLPSSLGHLGAPTASTDHLLDALRAGDWSRVAELEPALVHWSAGALASVFLDLADTANITDAAPARTWLLNRGVHGHAVLADGRTLLQAVGDGLPETLPAFTDLLARGASPSGGGVLAHVLAVAPPAVAGEPVRRLAADLLEHGADWCGPAPGGRSSLHLAVLAGELALADRLLERGADPNARDGVGRTPLHHALELDRDVAAPLVEALLRAGADPAAATPNGETPLGIALAREQPDFARWLDWSPWRLPGRRLAGHDLVGAADCGDLAAVDRLLSLGLAIDSRDAHGATALIRAAGNGHAALLVHLLERGADPACVARGGMHALGAAVGARRHPAVRTLLSHGVAPDLPLAGGATTLALAAALGEVAIAQALLEAGADANAADAAGQVPLHAAAQFAFAQGDPATAFAMVDLLVGHGARVEACNQAGQDVLMLLLGAASPPGSPCDAENLRGLVECLLRHGAPLDRQDQRGVGALHACALHGLHGCARLLKAYGAPLDQVDGFGRRAADVAALLGYAEVAAELGGRGDIPGVRQTLRQPAGAPE
ncbi:MAG: ankyrin repeat domain-containing protein [Xanthomonadales bacterium]|nr:ankyrin repeat domain-containing protein [Xanthomonadales bacterium]